MDRGMRRHEHILWIRICVGEDEWRDVWDEGSEVRGREGGVRVVV